MRRPGHAGCPALIPCRPPASHLPQPMFASANTEAKNWCAGAYEIEGNRGRTRRVGHLCRDETTTKMERSGMEWPRGIQ